MHVLRDGRDGRSTHVREHPDRRWVDGARVKVPNTKSIEEHAKRWVADTATGMRWRGDPRYLEVRYEDFVRTPEETLARVPGFLGEPYEAGLFAVDGAARPAAAAAEAAPPGPPGRRGRDHDDLDGALGAGLLGDDREVVRLIAGCARPSWATRAASTGSAARAPAGRRRAAPERVSRPALDM
ncbi:MAG: sulfotransferase [Chloroflexota bacterium]